MPKSTILEMSPEEQAPMLAARRRARYGYVLALPLWLWCAAGRTPTAIAAVLFGARSSVYRGLRAYRAGLLGLEPDDDGQLRPPVRPTGLVPTLRRSLLALLHAPPRASGWCRTRWSCATLAATLQAKRGRTVSAQTMRRWVHAVGWVWKRAQRLATADAPPRVERLARIRFVSEPWQASAAMVLADALDLHWLPKGGSAGRPHGPQGEVMTPGTNEQHYLAGALDLPTGTRHHGRGPRTTHGLCRDVRHPRELAYPTAQYPRLSGVVDHDKIHQATAGEAWLAQHLRLRRRFWPTSCPRAHPLERAFGDGQDLCTRHHTRTR